MKSSRKSAAIVAAAPAPPEAPPEPAPAETPADPMPTSGMVCLLLSDETAAALDKAFPAPEGASIPAPRHITLAFLGSVAGLDRTAIETAITAALSESDEEEDEETGGEGSPEDTDTISGTFAGWARFAAESDEDGNEGGALTPIVALFDSPDLDEIQAALSEALEAVGMPEPTHGFMSHSTMFRVDLADTDSIPMPAPPMLAATFSEIALVWGDYTDPTNVTLFPIAGPDQESAPEEEAPMEEPMMAAATTLGATGGSVSDKPWDGSAGRFTDEQYQRAAAACDPASKGTIKSRCFSGDTEILTRDGIVRLADVVDTDQFVLSAPIPTGTADVRESTNRTGRWIQAPIRSFGEQRLLTVKLRRNGREKTVRATPEHEWFASADNRSRKRLVLETMRTDELRPGMSLGALVPKPASRTRPSPVGIMAGMVFGDGSKTSTNSGCNVKVWGHKDATLRFFDGHAMTEGKNENEVRYTEVRGLPTSFKDLPSLDEGLPFLMGWLAGYFAADGCVDEKGMVILASCRAEHLEFARTVALRLGIATHATRVQHRVDVPLPQGGTIDSDLFSVRFIRGTVPPEMFLLPEHRRRFDATPIERVQARWQVVAVEDPGEAEEVFCAVVPDLETFALADYVWVHNCFLPHHEPGGAVNRNGVHAAAQRVGSLSGRSPDAVAKAKGHLHRHYTTDLKEDPPDSVLSVTTAGAAPPLNGVPIPLPVPEWEALILTEGEPTDDGRTVAPGALSWRPLPLSFTFQPIDSQDAHDDAPVGGAITEIARDGNMVMARGIYAQGPLGETCRAMVDDPGMPLAPSIRMADDSMTMQINAGPGGQNMMVLDGLLLNFCLVPVEAQASTWIRNLAPALPMMPDMPMEPMMASACACDDSRDSWRFTGALIACAAGNGAPVHPPEAWFDFPPELDSDGPPMALQITSEGRVFGHLAGPGCHLAKPGQCLTVGATSRDFTLFHHGGDDPEGGILTAEGTRIRVGALTMSGGHASLRASADEAMAHYDDPDRVGAFFRAGWDGRRNLPYVAGAVLPRVSEEDLQVMRALGVSGDWRIKEDWRTIDGKRTLVGLALVPVPGWPQVWRQAVVASGALMAEVVDTFGALRADESPLEEPEPVPEPVAASAWLLEAAADGMAAEVLREPWAEEAAELAGTMGI